MGGKYAGGSGFSVTFHPESATIACKDAERAYGYTVQRTANQILLKIQGDANPTTLQLKSDGTLFGDGTIQVNGRVIVGVNEDPKNRYVFAPKIERCAVGSLVLGDVGVSTPTAAVPASAPATSTAGSANPAASTDNTGGGNAAAASLSIVSGFAAQTGVANPLAGKSILVIKDSFENILAKAGWIQPGSSMKAVTAWARACEARSPLCQQGIEALRPYLVASGKLDGNGGFTFDKARAGSYYLVGQTSYNAQHLVWDLRVDLKPGANSITLDQRNTTPIDR